MSNGIMSRKPTQSGQPPRAAGINLGAPPFMQKPSIGSSIIPAEKTGVLGKMDYMRLMKMAERMTDKELQQEMVRPQQFPQAITAAVAMGRAKTRKASALNEMAKGPKMPTVSEQVLAELSKEDSIDRGLADMAAFAQMSQNMGSPKGGIDRGMNPTMGVKEGGIIKYQNRGQVRSNPYSLMSGAQAMPVAFDMGNYLGGMGLNRKQEEYARQIAEMAKAQGISEDRIPYLINTALAESSLGANPAAFKVTEGDSSAGFYQAVPTTAFDPGFGAQGFQFSEGVSEALAPFRDKNLGPGALAKQLKGTKYGDSDLYTAMQNELIENIPGNINFGIGYQNALMDRYGGDPELSAIAYNQGAAYADQIKNTMEKAASGQEGFSDFEGMSAAEILKLTNPKAYEEAYGSKEGQPSYMDRMLSGTGAEASSVDFKAPGAKGSSVFPDLSTLTTLEQVQKEQNKLLPIIGTEFGSNRSRALDKLEKEIKNKQDPFYISPDDPRVLEAAMERGNMSDLANKNVDPITQMAKDRKKYTFVPKEGTGGAPKSVTEQKEVGVDPRLPVYDESGKNINMEPPDTPLEKTVKKAYQGTKNFFGNVFAPADIAGLDPDAKTTTETAKVNEKTLVNNIASDINNQVSNVNLSENPEAANNAIGNTLNNLNNQNQNVAKDKRRSFSELLDDATDAVNKVGGGVKNQFDAMMNELNKQGADSEKKFNYMAGLPFFEMAQGVLEGENWVSGLIKGSTRFAKTAFQIQKQQQLMKDKMMDRKIQVAKIDSLIKSGDRTAALKLAGDLSKSDAAIEAAKYKANMDYEKLNADVIQNLKTEERKIIENADFQARVNADTDATIQRLKDSNRYDDKEIDKLRSQIFDYHQGRRVNERLMGKTGEGSVDLYKILNQLPEKEPGLLSKMTKSTLNWIFSWAD